jgi:hypothetical protein
MQKPRTEPGAAVILLVLIMGGMIGLIAVNLFS